MPVLQKKSRNFSPTRTIALSFILVILTGTALLMLPISSNSGEFTPFTHSLFTATSATCVTGLVIYDTLQHWSAFGQGIILLMIQIGGLGLVTFVAFFNFFIGKKLGLRRIQVATESVNASGFNDVRGLVGNIIKICLVTEAIGAVLLMPVFIPKYGVAGIFKSIFISISAYCNAGFDILGDSTAFASLTEFASNPYIVIIVMLLIISGGLGFVVWYDLLNYRKTKHLELHSKIILIFTGLLVVVGGIVFLILEWNNTKTIADMNFGDKVVNSFFQSVTCRTAGFNTIDTASLNPMSKVFSIMLMFIGAAPGSTGGGIKITTAVVILMTVISVLQNKDDTIILGRKVDKTTVYKSLTIIMLSITIVAVSTLTIFNSLKETAGVSGLDSLFETVSAFATVGLSVGVTSVANLLVELILIFVMFLGRVGPISVALFLVIKNADKTKKQVYPEGKILVG